MPESRAFRPTNQASDRASFSSCPCYPFIGHSVLRARFDDAIICRDGIAGICSCSGGPSGVGKQRLASVVRKPAPRCARVRSLRPCGVCQHCRYALAGNHPDIHWYFPRPRPKAGDMTPEKIEDDFREAISERTATGVYAPPAPEEGLYISTIRAMIHSASMAPAMAARKVYILGEAERMVLQEGSEEAAGAFLKLLEEPPAKATIILTTGEPGALIPTIRSRVVGIRVPALSGADLDAVLAEPAMQAAIVAAGGPKKLEEQRRVANGAPGALVAGAEWAAALARARRILDAAAES